MLSYVLHVSLIPNSQFKTNVICDFEFQFITRIRCDCRMIFGIVICIVSFPSVKESLY